MWLFVAGVGLILGGGCVGLLGRGARPALVASSLSAVAGSLLALLNAAQVLFTSESVEATIPSAIPLGTWSIGMDPLSAVFVVPIAIVVAAAAIYGMQYLGGSHYAARRGTLCFFFNVLAASMLLVVTARNGLFFLMVWEGMSLASFFLVMSEPEREPVRRAGWTYLIAMHIGTACLWVLFLLLGQDGGSLDFARLSSGTTPVGVLFLLSVVGFGTKAGLVPLHVWLPEAHPAAPSHVSAVMSGVMIKTGIYGLFRTLAILGELPTWCGWTLVAIGVASGVYGIAFAAAQHDLKRLLAYCSVENIGIIVLGMGVGVLGVSSHNGAMAFFGFLGALLHIFNHALFKSLLFLGAGCVQFRTGTRDMNQLGGLLKRMPITGGTFLVGACAISGLPPLNGFVSELLICLGVLAGLTQGDVTGGLSRAPLGVFGIGGLALIGGLSAVCFSKAFGSVFLGTARSQDTSLTQEVGWSMYGPMVLLAILCVFVAAAAPIWPHVLSPAIGCTVPAAAVEISPAVIAQAAFPLGLLSASFGILLSIIGALAWFRRRLLRGRQVASSVTWDCGYAGSVARAQYTPSSFVRPIVVLLRLLLQPAETIEAPRDLFPTTASFASHVGDVFRDRVYRPTFLAFAWFASQLRWLNQGRIQLYVLYIALTILTLLIWKMG